MLRVDNLTFKYPKSEKGIFDISFSIDSGEILALVGNNGSGKSTLLNQIYTKHKKDVVFVPQFFNISSMTVRDFVGLGFVREFKKFQLNHTKEQKARIEEVLEISHILDIANNPINKISGGQRQIAKIAQALLIKPKILLLDEPISHLDLANSAKTLGLVKEFCQKESACAIIILHDIYAVRKFADFVLMLKNGRQFGLCEAEKFDDKIVSELFFSSSLKML